MMHFHWYCTQCKRGLGIDSADPRYFDIWRGRDFEYTHHVDGVEHVLSYVDAQQMLPDYHKVILTVDGRDEVCDWLPFVRH